MKIGFFIPVYNEEYLIKIILDYYFSIPEIEVHVHLYDNGSTDNTLKIAATYGDKVSVHSLPYPGLDDRNHLWVKNEAWKEYREKYLWVIACDLDEVLFEISNLSKTRCNLIFPLGFNIYSDENLTPENFIEIRAYSFFDKNFSKKVCFKPSEIENINFQFGAHNANPVPRQGFKIYTESGFKLYHYRCIGGVNRMIERHREYKKRMSEYNRKFGLGSHYLRTEADIKLEWSRNMRQIMSNI